MPEFGNMKLVQESRMRTNRPRMSSFWMQGAMVDILTGSPATAENPMIVWHSEGKRHLS